MIKVRDLQKAYGNKLAVKNISFNVDDGEVFGFLGPNGAGKSTTIRMLTGQVPPTAGQIEVMGHQLPAKRHLLVGSMGITPEDANLYERLSVGENLNLFCRLYRVPTSRGADILQRVGMLESIRVPVKKLSKGMRQRILLARAILHSPRLLFLDEPTSGLDPGSAASMQDILIELNRHGTTIFVTTHNMAEADRLCHRVAFLNEGRIAEIGKPEELKRRYGEERLVVKVQSGENQTEHSLPLRGEATAKQVGAWLSNGQVVSIHSVESTLADIFIRVTGRRLA